MRLASQALIFLGVTDPVGAGVVKDIQKPVLSTGVVDLPPFEKILALIRQLYPNAHSIGMPYSPDEQPAIFSRDRVGALASKYGFTVAAKPVASIDELPSIVRSLLRENDIILTGADNKMFDQAPQVSKLCLDAGKPFFSGDSTSIKAGAVAGYSVDYRDVGRQGAKLAARVVRGEKAGEIPVVLLSEGKLELNERSAQRLGLQLTPQLRSSAAVIYR